MLYLVHTALEANAGDCPGWTAALKDRRKPQFLPPWECRQLTAGLCNISLLVPLTSHMGLFSVPEHTAAFLSPSQAWAPSRDAHCGACAHTQPSQTSTTEDSVHPPCIPSAWTLRAVSYSSRSPHVRTHSTHTDLGRSAATQGTETKTNLPRSHGRSGKGLQSSEPAAHPLPGDCHPAMAPVGRHLCVHRARCTNRLPDTCLELPKQHVVQTHPDREHAARHVLTHTRTHMCAHARPADSPPALLLRCQHSGSRVRCPAGPNDPSRQMHGDTPA